MVTLIQINKLGVLLASISLLLVLVMSLASGEEAEQARWRIQTLSGSAHLNGTQLDDEARDLTKSSIVRIETENDSAVLLTAGDGGVILLGPASRLEIGEPLVLQKGRVAVVTNHGDGVVLSIDQDAAIKFDLFSSGVQVMAENQLTLCWLNEPKPQPGMTESDSSRSACWLYDDNRWKPADDAAMLDWRLWLSDKALAFELATLPKENQSGGASEKEDGQGEGAQQEGGGASVCLDAAGSDASASDPISGDGSQVELERGKAVIRVNVKIGD